MRFLRDFKNKQKEKEKIKRAFKRTSCYVKALLCFPEKNVSFEGLILEISRGGLRFREASSFVMDRTGKQAVITCGNLSFPGKIVNTSAHGYGFKLKENLEQSIVDQIFAQSLKIDQNGNLVA